MQLLLALFFCFSARAEVLPGLASVSAYAPFLQGKRVALVVNQASVLHGEHAIEFLRRQNVNLIKLYALEHGVRGEGGAGEPIGDGVDPQSGLPIISLYGAIKKPDAHALAGVTAIVFDIQDVGVRFFTYISSLGLILEAAAENHIPVIVLDRPNPNGDYVDGPVLQPGLHSFVGAYPIPIVYGLTMGELARMIVAEGWQHTAGISLRVIPLQNYTHSMIVAPEVKPSPGLKTLNAIRIYPSLALFEPTQVSIGRGTEHPFEVYGQPGGVGNYSFIPSGDVLFSGQLCIGEEFFSRESVPHFTTDYFSKLSPVVTNRHFLELLVGNKAVVDRMLRGEAWASIRYSLKNELSSYMRMREKYFLYH